MLRWCKKEWVLMTPCPDLTRSIRCIPCSQGQCAEFLFSWYRISSAFRTTNLQVIISSSPLNILELREIIYQCPIKHQQLGGSWLGVYNVAWIFFFKFYWEVLGSTAVNSIQRWFCEDLEYFSFLRNTRVLVT